MVFGFFLFFWKVVKVFWKIPIHLVETHIYSKPPCVVLDVFVEKFACNAGIQAGQPARSLWMN